MTSSPLMPPAPFAGIEAMGLALPTDAITADTLAELRSVPVDKLRLGLGCEEIGLVPPEQDALPLAVLAAERALADWGGDRSRVGLLAWGSETARDMSRPLSAWLADALDLRGAIRSYEVKHACYGGTLALRQAAEWVASGAADDRVALVLAADVARYAPGSPGEPTMGAGAVAFIVGREPRVAELDRRSASWSAPAFDFWRPVGRPWPEVDGPLSQACYLEGATACYRQLAEADPQAWLESFGAHSLHVPFPGMARKAFRHAFVELGLDAEVVDAHCRTQVEPDMAWNRRCGNAYTASLWIAVAHALARLGEGARISAFSYGSGYGCELLTLRAGPACASATWARHAEADLAARRYLDAEEYEQWRQAEASAAGIRI